MDKMKKLHYGIDIVLTIIIVLLLLGSCQATNTSQVKLETYSERKSSNPEDWTKQVEKTNQVIGALSDLTNKVSPEDLCRPQYRNEIDQMGIRLINLGNEGSKLTYTGDGNLFPNYTKYKDYFNMSIDMGNQVRELSRLIQNGKYKESIQILSRIIDHIEKMEVM